MLFRSVITETKGKKFNGGSNWYFRSKKKLIWEDIRATNINKSGTRVEVHFRKNATITYSSVEEITRLIQRNYLPLFDNKFLDLYDRLGYYKKKLKFFINGQEVSRTAVQTKYELEQVREFVPKSRKKGIGYGLFGLSKKEYPIDTDICGILLCTCGKVIKADLFNQFPSNYGPRIFGLVEVPGFIDFLTTSKADFFRRGRTKSRKFESLYDPIRQEFKSWLSEIGVQTTDVDDSEEGLKLERELRKVIEDIPELSNFFGFRSKQSALQKKDDGSISAIDQDGIEITYPIQDGEGLGEMGPTVNGDKNGQTLIENEKKDAGRAEPISRKAKRGPKVGFVEAPDKVDLAWVDGNQVVINSGHPAYLKIKSDKTAKRIHCLYAIGSAVQRYLAVPEDETEDLFFADRLLSAWGDK